MQICEGKHSSSHPRECKTLVNNSCLRVSDWRLSLHYSVRSVICLSRFIVYPGVMLCIIKFICFIIL